MKKIIKAFVPPVLWNLFSCFLGKNLEYFGNFSCFSDANAVAKKIQKRQGYGGINKQRMIQNITELKLQDNVYSRDGNNNIIASILLATLKRGSKGAVFVDWGGGDGSFYFSNKDKFFNIFESYSYHVIELQEVVEFGNEVFADDKLSFQANMDELPIETKIDDLKVLILQGVLMYLDQPFEMLEKIFQKIQFDLVVVDRTAFSKDGSMFFKVQKIPKHLGWGGGANPWQCFCRQDIIDFFAKQGFQLFDDFNDPLDSDSHDFVMRGMSFFKKV